MDTPVKIHQYTNTPPRLSVVEKVPLSDRGDVGTAIDALGIGPYLVCSSVARPLLRRSPSQLTRHSCVSRLPSAPTRLEDMCKLAPPGEGFEVGGGQGAATMCPLIAERVGDPQPDSRQLLKLVRMAGLQPWPRIFHMMWVSCETDLLESFPISASDWLGHSATLALAHLTRLPDHVFERAVRGGAESGAVRVQKALRTTPDR